MIKVDPLLAHIKRLMDEENNYKHRYPNFVPLCKTLIDSLTALGKIQDMDSFSADILSREIASDALLNAKQRLIGRSKRAP